MIKKEEKLSLIRQRQQRWMAERKTEANSSTHSSNDSIPAIARPVKTPPLPTLQSPSHQQMSEVDVSIDNWIQLPTSASSNQVSSDLDGIDDEEAIEMATRYKLQYEQYCSRCELLKAEAETLTKDRIDAEGRLSNTVSNLQKAQEDYKEFSSLIERYLAKVKALDTTIHESQAQLKGLEYHVEAISSQEKNVLKTLSKLEKQKANAKIIWTGIQSSLSQP